MSNFNFTNKTFKKQTYINESGKAVLDADYSLRNELLEFIDEKDLKWDSKNKVFVFEPVYVDSVETLLQNRRFSPPKQNNTKLETAKKDLVGKTHFTTENGVKKICLTGYWFDYKDQLKELIPYDDRKWDSASKMWVVNYTDKYDNTLQEFIDKINDKKAIKDKEMSNLFEMTPRESFKRIKDEFVVPNEIIEKNDYKNINSFKPRKNKSITIIGEENDFNKREGMNYQFITGVLVEPVINQKVVCYVDGNPEEYIITEILSKLQFLAKKDDEINYFVVSAGSWTNHKYHLSSEVKFLPL